MKNIIITLISFIFLVLPGAANQYIQAELLGFPSINENSVTANLNLSYLQIGFSRLFVSASDNYIINNEFPEIKIPITDLYLLCDGQEFQITKSGWQRFFIDNFDIERVVQKNINLKLENIGTLPSGTYTTVLKFLNKTGLNLDYECEFLFSFIVDEKQSITSLNGDAVILLSEEDIFNKHSLVKNQNDIRLDLISNTKWKLWLNTSNFEENNCDYYFQVKNITGKINNYEQNNIKLLPNQRYLLASGEATLEGTQFGNIIPTNLTVEYSLKNTENDSYIKEGINRNFITYILERE